MSIERLKSMKEKAMMLAEQGLCQDVSCIDAKELGEIVDVVKDLGEAIYYCAITDAMEKTDDEEKYMKKYLPEMAYARSYSPYYRKPIEYPEMYYSSNSGGRSSGNSSMMANYSRRRMYSDPWDMHDVNDGESWQYRRNYMNGKMDKKTDSESMKDLEEYIKSLSEDIMEMIEDATPTEKSTLRQKINTLATKIV